METGARMSWMPGWLRWISPWIALGLAVALVIVLMRPAAEVSAPPWLPRLPPP
jgi:protein-S-isoprenylcysteine O-methyltransferase Ste14